MQSIRDRIIAIVLLALLVASGGTPSNADQPEWEFPLLAVDSKLYFRAWFGEPVIGDQLKIVTARGNLISSGLRRVHIEELWGIDAADAYTGDHEFSWFADGEPVSFVPDPHGHSIITQDLLGKTLTGVLTVGNGRYEPVSITTSLGGYGGQYSLGPEIPFGPVVERGASVPEISIVQSGPGAVIDHRAEIGNTLSIALSEVAKVGVDVQVCWITYEPHVRNAVKNDRGCQPELLIAPGDLGNVVSVSVFFRKAGEATQIRQIEGTLMVSTILPPVETTFTNGPHLIGNKWLEGSFKPSSLWGDYLWYEFTARLSDGREVFLYSSGSQYNAGKPVWFSAQLPTLDKALWGERASIVARLHGVAHHESEFVVATNVEVSGPEVRYNKEYKLKVIDLEATRGQVEAPWTLFSNELGSVCSGEFKCQWQWILGGEVVSTSVGAFNANPYFEISASESGRKLAQRVILSDPNFGQKTYTTPSITLPKVWQASPYPVKQPRLIGKQQVGQTLTVQNPVWSLPGTTTHKYQWHADGKSLAGATKSKYVIQPSDVGKQLRVKMHSSNSTALTGTVEINSGIVAKATPTVKGSLSKASIRRNQSTKLTVWVTVPGTKAPQGKVSVTVGGKTTKALLKASHKGKVSISLKGMIVGSKQAVKVKFVPSSGSTGKFAKVSKYVTVSRLTVKK